MRNRALMVGMLAGAALMPTSARGNIYVENTNWEQKSNSGTIAVYTKFGCPGERPLGLWVE